jgi:hypothetical protein
LEDKFLNNRSGNLMKHSRHAGIPLEVRKSHMPAGKNISRCQRTYRWKPMISKIRNLVYLHYRPKKERIMMAPTCRFINFLSLKFTNLNRGEEKKSKDA